MAKKIKLKHPAKMFRSIFKLIGTILLISGIIVGFIGCGVVSSSMIEAFNFNPEDFHIGRASSIYYTDAKGQTALYQNVNSESNRQWINYEKIPQYMIDAAVAIEDERFYKHNGVDIKRTLAAVFVNLTGSDSFGGSTITQQVVKNITRDDDRDAMRKVREILRALKFESEYSKDEIMEFYLNIAHFGSGNGIQAASYAYYGKDVSELNLAECASIVGITKYPTRYNPLLNPEKNKERQEIVLSKMLELEMITQEEHDEAVEYKLDFSNGKASQKNSESMQSYFTELVISQVIDDLIEEKGYTEAVAKSMIYNGGLTIYSTVNPKIQAAMEKVLENRSNYTTAKNVQAAMVIIDPYTGQVKGCVGGAGVKDRDLGLNRAVDTYRQPGSTIKPLAVYGPAMDEGIIYGPGSVVVDQPIDINGYKPKNWYGDFKGPTTVRQAIVQSMNTPAVQVVNEMGVNVSLSYLKRKYHISSISERDGLASVSLGGLTNGVNVLEWTAAYGTFPNDGEWISPICYTKVVDHSGKIILKTKQETERVFTAETNFMITDILRSTATAMGGAISNMTCAGKTGTTNNNVDKWYMGFTPYYVGGVWVGNDDSKPLSDGATMNSPQKIWRQVMTEVHKGLDNMGFSPAPKGVRQVNLCTQTGKIAAEDCESNYDYMNSDSIKYCDGEHPFKKEEEGENTEGEETPEGEVDEVEGDANDTESPSNQDTTITEEEEIPSTTPETTETTNTEE